MQTSASFILFNKNLCFYRVIETWYKPISPRIFLSSKSLYFYACIQLCNTFDILTSNNMLGLSYSLQRYKVRPGQFIYMPLHKKGTIVIYLVLQSTLTYVNEVAKFSVIAPKVRFTK